MADKVVQLQSEDGLDDLFPKQYIEDVSSLLEVNTTNFTVNNLLMAYKIGKVVFLTMTLISKNATVGGKTILTFDNKLKARNTFVMYGSAVATGKPVNCVIDGNTSYCGIRTINANPTVSTSEEIYFNLCWICQ